MNASTISLLLKDIIVVLSNPLIDINEVESTVRFMERELVSLYEAEKDIVDGIKYINSMLNEIMVYDARYSDNNYEDDKDRLHDIVLIADKYLCITDDNKHILESKFVIIECIIKTMMHLLWQRLYLIFNDEQMSLDTVYNASKLFSEKVGDVITKLKKCEIVKI